MSQLVSQHRKDSKRLIDDSSTGSQMPPRVSINANRFALVDPAGNRTEVPFLPDGPALDVVFVDRNQNTSKLFWGLGKTYDPSDLSPPVCFSDNGVAPSAQAMEPQSPTCAACPHNAIGSAISQVSGAKIRACQDLKKLAVVVTGFEGVYLFTIKPGSFKAWNNYTSFLRMQKMPDGGKPDLSDVVTRIRFSGQGVMSFEALALVDGDLAKQVIAVWDRNEQNDVTGMMIGRFDQPAQGVLPAPQERGLGSTPTPPIPPMPAAAPPPLPFQSQQPTAAPAQPAAAPANAKAPQRRAAKKDEPAQIVPPQPAPPTTTMPKDVQQRLSSLFNLPPVK